VPAFFVAGTGTDIGKTYVTAALLRALAGAGCATDALKPVVSGFDESAPAGGDPALLLEALGVAVTPAALNRISPWRYAAPLAPNQAARREGRELDAAAVTAFCRAAITASGETWLFIESAGGIMSPLDDDLTMLDLAQALAIPVLLIAGSYLGTISHAMTAARVIRGAGLGLEAVIVSESETGPALADAADEIARRLTDVPVVAIARGGDAAEVAEVVFRGYLGI
jgi:dethiobiotin synthetase